MHVRTFFFFRDATDTLSQINRYLCGNLWIHFLLPGKNLVKKEHGYGIPILQPRHQLAVVQLPGAAGSRRPHPAHLRARQLHLHLLVQPRRILQDTGGRPQGHRHRKDARRRRERAVGHRTGGRNQPRSEPPAGRAHLHLRGEDSSRTGQTPYYILSGLSHGSPSSDIYPRLLPRRDIPLPRPGAGEQGPGHLLPARQPPVPGRAPVSRPTSAPSSPATRWTAAIASRFHGTRTS